MGLFNYKILAFIVLFKKHRKNSLWFSNETYSDISKKLGISYNTLKKYTLFCKEKNLLIPYGDHFQFVKLTSAIDILKLDLNQFCSFYKWKHYEKLDFKIIYNEIIHSRLLLNFRTQQFNISKKRKFAEKVKQIENSKKTHPSVVKSIIKKFGSVRKAKSSISKNFTEQIITGKNHIAKIIGCSTSSSKNILRRMCKQKLIKRTVICQRLKTPFTFTGYDNIKQKNLCIVPSKKDKCFYASRGSVVSIL